MASSPASCCSTCILARRSVTEQRDHHLGSHDPGSSPSLSVLGCRAKPAAGLVTDPATALASLTAPALDSLAALALATRAALALAPSSLASPRQPAAHRQKENRPITRCGAARRGARCLWLALYHGRGDEPDT